MQTSQCLAYRSLQERTEGLGPGGLPNLLKEEENEEEEGEKKEYDDEEEKMEGKRRDKEDIK